MPLVHGPGPAAGVCDELDVKYSPAACDRCFITYLKGGHHTVFIIMMISLPSPPSRVQKKRRFASNSPPASQRTPALLFQLLIVHLAASVARTCRRHGRPRACKGRVHPRVRLKRASGPAHIHT